MKRTACYLPLLTFLLIPGCRHKEEFNAPPSIVLTKGWMFKASDSIDYSRTDLPDSTWRPIEVEGDWQDRGYPDYFGYAGYAIKTVIPSSLREGWGKDTLKIDLGNIAFYDQAYLNGHLIGENNITLPDTTKDIPDFRSSFPGLFLWRCYKIAANDKAILWDRENTIAVRIFSDFDNGGLWGGKPRLSMQGLNDFIIFDKSRFFSIVDQKRMDTLLVLRNIHSKLSFTGDLFLSANDTITKKEVFRYEKKGIKLEPGDSLPIPVSLPTSTDPICFISTFTETRLQQPLVDTTYIPFVLIK